MLENIILTMLRFIRVIGTKLNTKLIIFILLFICVPLKSLYAATYYVSDSTGSDSNPGTSELPFKTIQKSVDTVIAGDTVIVKDGTYTGSGYAIVEVDCTGTAENWITFRAENLYGAVVDGEEDRHGWNFSGEARYVRFEGFEVIRCAIGFRCNAPAHHIYIYNNKIHNIGRWQQDTCLPDNPVGGIFSGLQTSYWTIDSNLIYDVGRIHNPECINDYRWDHNIYSCGHHQLIQNNIIYNNYAGYCIKITSHYDSIPADANTHIVTNNTFAFDVNPVVSDYNGHIRLYHDAYNEPKNIIIQNNIFYNPPNDLAIRGYWYSGTTVRNNLCTGVMHEESSDPPIYENNQEYVDPLLVDPDEFDFMIQNNSPAINAGLSTYAPAYDYIGTDRPQGSLYDVGAYEYEEPLSAILPPTNFSLSY